MTAHIAEADHQALDTASLSTPHAVRPEGRKPLVCVRHVSKQFGNGTLAVRDVNLSLGEGEFVSLLGPSGCGKSTLLRMIAGLGAPSLRRGNELGAARQRFLEHQIAGDGIAGVADGDVIGQFAPQDQGTGQLLLDLKRRFGHTRLGAGRGLQLGLGASHRRELIHTRPGGGEHGLQGAAGTRGQIAQRGHTHQRAILGGHALRRVLRQRGVHGGAGARVADDVDADALVLQRGQQGGVGGKFRHLHHEIFGLWTSPVQYRRGQAQEFRVLVIQEVLQYGLYSLIAFFAKGCPRLLGKSQNGFLVNPDLHRDGPGHEALLGLFADVFQIFKSHEVAGVPLQGFLPVFLGRFYVPFPGLGRRQKAVEGGFCDCTL